MRICDISMPLTPGMAVYPGDPDLELTPEARLAPGDADSCNTSRLTLGTHTGTHVDPPLHFVPGGAALDALDLGLLCGPARVVDLRGRGQQIDAALLAGLPWAGVERVLFQTDNGRLLGGPFRTDYAAVTADGARFLRDRTGVRLVGIDYLSIEAHPSPGFPVHRTLLGAAPPILILEGLDLRRAPAGDHQLWCLPLSVPGADGGPARAVLLADSGD